MAYEIRIKTPGGWAPACPPDSVDPYRFARKAEARRTAEQLYPAQVRIGRVGGQVTIRIMEVK